MKKILLIILLAAETSLVWGQTITRSLPSSFVPPPPPPNQGAIQNVGSLEFYVFQQNMLAPLSQKKNAESGDINQFATSRAADQAIMTVNDARGSLLLVLSKSYSRSSFY